MTVFEIALSILILVLLALTIIGFSLAKRYYDRWRKKQTMAYEMGGRQVKGDMYQLLGTFAALDDYKQVIMLSTTSSQASLDLIGVTDDTIDFVEFKKKGADLKGPERKIRKLVRDKKVRYVIKDVELPEGFQVEDRPEGRTDMPL